MKEIVIIGAGQIGSTIAHLLAESGDYSVTLIDQSEAHLAAVQTGPALATATLDVADEAALVAMLSGKFAVLSAAPFQLTVAIATAAAKAKVHYIDLTEDVASTRKVREIAADAETAFIPQSGLAPGFISIVAHDLAQRFDSLETVRMRVGALPQFPSNALKYNLTWSTDGVVNEYIEPCEAIVNGRKVEVPALEGLEEFALDGVTYEAFNTSGGLGTLTETLAGKVQTMDYRTVRYPGHRAIMKTLLQDLGLQHRREVLKDVLEHAIPMTKQDLVLIFVTVTGQQNGRLVQENYANKIYAAEVAGQHMTAIQITTASSACAVVDLLANGKLPQKGFVRQEQISLDQFLSNRFGKAYSQ